MRGHGADWAVDPGQGGVARSDTTDSDDPAPISSLGSRRGPPAPGAPPSSGEGSSPSRTTRSSSPSNSASTRDRMAWIGGTDATPSKAIKSWAKPAGSLAQCVVAYQSRRFSPGWGSSLAAKRMSNTLARSAAVRWFTLTGSSRRRASSIWWR